MNQKNNKLLHEKEHHIHNRQKQYKVKIINERRNKEDSLIQKNQKQIMILNSLDKKIKTKSHSNTNHNLLNPNLTNTKSIYNPKNIKNQQTRSHNTKKVNHSFSNSFYYMNQPNQQNKTYIKNIYNYNMTNNNKMIKNKHNKSNKSDSFLDYSLMNLNNNNNQKNNKNDNNIKSNEGNNNIAGYKHTEITSNNNKNSERQKQRLTKIKSLSTKFNNQIYKSNTQNNHKSMTKTYYNLHKSQTQNNNLSKNQRNLSQRKTNMNNNQSKDKINPNRSLINPNNDSSINSNNLNIHRSQLLLKPYQTSNNQLQNKFKYSYSYRTRKGRHINYPNKTNQDSILVKQNISKKDVHMIAVADGHGNAGHHELSKLFSQQFNNMLKNQQKNKNTNNQEQYFQVSLILPKIYDKIQNQLTCSEINSATSGSTLVNVILQKNQILCANVGDSRAILARQMDKKNWELIYLSEDHKPENQNQKKRILKSGGHVHSFKGINGQNLGPLRVWLPNQNIQGLAMTRSFGDNISKCVGVTYKPQLIKVKIDSRDKFILVASDGVWQFIKNQQILQLIVPFYKQNKLQQACDQLLKLAYARWTCDDNSVVDDISFVLVFLNC